ncbi:hypothetical protein ABPG73_006461 [Tetrahymena malaccensis]
MICFTRLFIIILFIKINRENTFTTQALSYLLSKLSECSKLQNLSLNLEQTYITDHFTKNLGSELSKCTSLSSLDLNLSYLGDIAVSNLGIGDKGVKDLCFSIAKCKNLKELLLGFNWKKTSDRSAADLCQDLSRCDTLSDFLLM